MSSKDVVMDIDYILDIGWDVFVEIVNRTVGQTTCTSNMDKISDEAARGVSYEHIDDLSSAMQNVGALYINKETRSEQRYHLSKKLFTRILLSDMDKFKKFDNTSDGAHLSYLINLSPYVAESSIPLAKEFFRDQLLMVLKTKDESEEYEVQMILDEIKYLWEYEAVLSMVNVFGNDYHRIASLPNRDRKKEYRKKEKFNKRKKEALAFFKDCNIDLANLDVVQGFEYEEHPFEYRHTAFKAVKERLYTSLVSTCGTGKQRADIISKVIDYI